MDDEDFLDAISGGDEDVAETVTAVTPTEPAQPEPAVLELTDPVTPAEPAPAEPAPEPMRNDDAADGRLAALLDERDKRKAAEAELQRYRAAEQAQASQPAQRPDEWEDPDGARAYDKAVIDTQLYQQRLHFSEQLAAVKYGEDTVKAAMEWGFNRCQADPHFNAKARSSLDPVGFAVAEYQREEIASKVTPDEFAQFQAWKNAQGQLQQQGGQPSPPNTASAIPPKSLASAPSAGGITTQPIQSDEEIFAEVIPKR